MASSEDAQAPPRRGLLIDFGGVLTTNVFHSFAAFSAAEGLAPETVRDAFRGEGAARQLLFDLELGHIGEEPFETQLAAALGLAPERAAGVVRRLFAGMAPDEAMIEAVATIHAAGLPTGLISNSWGTALDYDAALMDRLFDGLVISHLEGMRKPDPAIYVLGAERIGMAPEDLVFVDDLGGNLKPARALGMATVRHVTAQETLPQLEALLGVSLT